MTTNCSERKWYAIRVKSNCERIVANGLDHRDYEKLLPAYQKRRKWSDRVIQIEAPLFPGYVFCRLNIHLRLPVLQTPGVVSFVAFGREPAAIEDHVIEALQAIIKSGVPVAPWPFLQVGQRVRINHGPL